MLFGQPIRQICFFTENVREAATRHSKLFGSGPYFIKENSAAMWNYRGQQVWMDTSAAFGQWGNMQVEFFQQNNDCPSTFRELFPAGSGKTGLHHVAIIVDHLETAVRELTASGCPEAQRLEVPSMDLTAVFIDALAVTEHFIELYEPVPALPGLYDLVARAHESFDGTDPVRRFPG